MESSNNLIDDDNELPIEEAEIDMRGDGNGKSARRQVTNSIQKDCKRDLTKQA